MTPLHLLILRAVESYRREHGFAPTEREIGARIDRATSTVCETLDRMQERGMITRQKGRHRGVVIVAPSEPSLEWLWRVVRPRPKVKRDDSRQMPLTEA